jgi:hypothetical protein
MPEEPGDRSVLGATGGPTVAASGRWRRRIAPAARVASLALLAILIAAPTLVQSKSSGKPGTKNRRPAAARKNTAKAPASQPAAPLDPAATQPTPDETVAQALTRLSDRRWRPDDRDVALRCTLQLCIALGGGDPQRAAGLLDVVGYQPLPLDGELPDEPGKPLNAGAFASQLENRPRFDASSLPAVGFSSLNAREVAGAFPAVARWMLPEDYAVVIEPAGSSGAWVQRRCCVVVRVRGSKPIIVGGNLLQALPPRP